MFVNEILISVTVQMKSVLINLCFASDAQGGPNLSVLFIIQYKGGQSSFCVCTKDNSNKSYWAVLGLQYC